METSHNNYKLPNNLENFFQKVNIKLLKSENNFYLTGEYLYIQQWYALPVMVFYWKAG